MFPKNSHLAYENESAKPSFSWAAAAWAFWAVVIESCIMDAFSFSQETQLYKG